MARKRQTCVAATALLVGSFCGCAQVNQYVRSPFGDPIRQQEMQYDFAQVVERNGDLHRAEKTYREMAAAKPKVAKYHHRLGVVLVRQGKLEEGLAELSQAVQLDADNATMLNDLGYAQLLKGEYAVAEQTIRKSLEIDARDPRARNNLALAVGYEGRTREAYELFRQHQTEAEARANLAYVHTQRGELIEATREYDRSLSKNPEFKPAAEALLQLTQMQRGIHDSNLAPSGDVQFASRTVPAATAADRSRKSLETPRTQLQDKHASLVELLGEIEAEEAAQANRAAPASDSASIRTGVNYFEWEAPRE